MPGWLQPFLVLGSIIALDLVIGQIVEPLLFGETTGVTPLALILSAIFWGTLWGPIGLLLATPLTICLLVLGRHVPHLGFLQILLGDEPALAPYQQIYRRLMRKAVADASEVALAEIEQKGAELGLDDGMGRMVVLAETDHALDRLTAGQIDAIVEGTDDVLDFLADTPDEGAQLPEADASAVAAREVRAAFRCVGGRGEIDDAAAAIIAFALRRHGMEARSSRRGDTACRGRERRIVHDPPDLLRLAPLRRGAAIQPAQAEGRRRARTPRRHRLRRRPRAGALDRRRRGTARHAGRRCRDDLPTGRAACGGRGAGAGCGGGEGLTNRICGSASAEDITGADPTFAQSSVIGSPGRPVRQPKTAESAQIVAKKAST